MDVFPAGPLIHNVSKVPTSSKNVLKVKEEDKELKPSVVNTSLNPFKIAFEEIQLDPPNMSSCEPSGKKLEVPDERTDVITMHTIKLLQYHRKLESIIDLCQTKMKHYEALPEVPEIPVLPECILTYRRPGDIEAKLAGYAVCKDGAQISSSHINEDDDDSDAVDDEGKNKYDDNEEDGEDRNEKSEEGDVEIEDGDEVSDRVDMILDPLTDNKMSIAAKSAYNLSRDFVDGKGDVPPKVSFRVAWRMLRKSIAIIFAHAGCEKTSEVVLDTMTDVVEDFYVRTCSLLSANVRRRYATPEFRFLDIVEQTFHDIGLESMTIVGDYYQTRIVDYHETVLNSCKQLLNEYEQLRCEASQYVENESQFKSESTSDSSSEETGLQFY